MGHAQPPDFAIPWWWSAALVLGCAMLVGLAASLAMG
jgi:hypothetical protein